MSPISIRRDSVVMFPKSERVILRFFIPSDHIHVGTIINRALALSEEDVQLHLKDVRAEFEFRHFDLNRLLMAHYERIHAHFSLAPTLSETRKLLIGALFSGEYALESAALFNPSIVPHPDQSNLPLGSVRFIISLRATGEGHVSSIEFRSGVILVDGSITMDSVSGFVTKPERLTVPECLLTDSNYTLQFCSTREISERVIFPASPTESNGIEDARFVKFIEDDGSFLYYATYTAYNGHSILPQMIETQDFLHFRILTLHGTAVQNKGMALFPRRINGRYAMLSRQDDENLFIMFSDNPHTWSNPQIIMRPSEMWESIKIGNCGSPIETEAGWLVITHGVGAMRKYCIGAALLDLHDPTKVLGRLKKPLLAPEGSEREGYVPNVVYSCGSMLHGKQLILPYAIGDRATVITSLLIDDLLKELLE